MSQIAQQDHLYIEVGEKGLDELGPAEFPALEEKFKAGTLMDCIFRTDDGSLAKILGAEVNEAGVLGSVYYMSSGVIGTISRE